jgi:ferredoxin
MSDVDERTVGELTIQIDRLICVGFGDCAEVSQDAFELDDDGIAVFKDTIDNVDHAELTAACESCPVDALIVLDSSGVQIVP